MNRYSLGSDSRVWWLPAGAAALVAAAVLAVPLLPSSGSVPTHPSSPPAVGTPDVQRGYAHIPYRHCPPPPNPKYVGVPWASPQSHCATLRSWWKYVG